jgi:dihydropteroate synthase
MAQPKTRENTHFVYRFGTRTYDLSSRTHIMGVLNVTPDSFSDGGTYVSPERAVEQAIRMVDDGADFLDIGGESTRPKGKAYGDGAEPISAEEELKRILPVIEKVASLTDVPISVDTYKSGVAREALAAGAVVVNDISGFHSDPAMPDVVARAGASAVLMHMRGTPKTMQQNPEYKDLFGEIREYLSEGLALGHQAGIRQLIVDPGIGFGKTLAHNLRLIAGLPLFGSLGYPLLVGPSRKSFIGSILDLPTEERLEGTLASVVAAVLRGANVVRVHDVKAVKRAVQVADAIRQAGNDLPD